MSISPTIPPKKAPRRYRLDGHDDENACNEKDDRGDAREDGKTSAEPELGEPPRPRFGGQGRQCRGRLLGRGSHVRIWVQPGRPSGRGSLSSRLYDLRRSGDNGAVPDPDWVPGNKR